LAGIGIAFLPSSKDKWLSPMMNAFMEAVREAIAVEEGKATTS